jgi:hypothetical protein
MRQLRREALTVLLALSLAGCASAPQGEALEAAAPAGPGETILDILATPILIGFKIPVCVTTLGVALPLAATTGFGTGDGAPAARRELGQGIDENCGPPYLVGASSPR